MGSKYLLRRSPSPLPISSFSVFHHHLHTLHRSQLLLSPFPPKPIYDFLSLSQRKPGFCYSALSTKVPTPVLVEQQAGGKIDVAGLDALRLKLEQQGIPSTTGKPGEYILMLCPQCEGGASKERSFSLFISADCDLAMWKCYGEKCGCRGHIKALENGKPSSSPNFANIGKSNIKRVITEESIGLEPLGDELIAYFAKRMISEETLLRNAVMQTSGDEAAIAFTYRRNGVLISCKYRDIKKKKFWQERATEKILYGLDDIKDASDIIIVEGEMDKLSMEEAGFRNCVSVPDGAPFQVSNKELPPADEDKKYQYLWNCKEYLTKVSRIILATDGDQPGQALAEELARRLGKERCWCVRWPKKNDVEVCKDANEVLMCLGPHALREMVDKAELYPIHDLVEIC